MFTRPAPAFSNGLFGDLRSAYGPLFLTAAPAFGVGLHVRPLAASTVAPSATVRPARTVRPIVACAMPLAVSTMEALSEHLGCAVVDIREAPETTHIVLAPALSVRATSILAEMFPLARVVTCEYLDDRHPLDIPAFSVADSYASGSLSLV